MKGVPDMGDGRTAADEVGGEGYRSSPPGGGAADVWLPLAGRGRGPVLHHLLMLLGLTLVGAVVGTLGLVSLPAGLGVGGFWFAMTLQAVGGLLFGGWGVLAGTLMGLLSNAFSRELPVYVLGLIPANFIQSFLTAWVFRRWRLDPSLPTRRELAVFVGVGPVLSNLLGGSLAIGALSLAGLLAGSAQAGRVLLGWTVGNGIPCLLLGVPLLRTFAPQVMDSPFFCRSWWGGGRPMEWHSPRYADLPVMARLLIEFALGGVAPMMVVAIVGLVGLERRSPEFNRLVVPLMLSTSIFLSLIVSGLAARRMRSRVGTLMEGVRRLGRGDLDHRVPDLGRDELGRMGKAFNDMASALGDSREALRLSTEARARDLRELEIARDIQRSFLPREYPAVPGLTFAARTTPARQVGGDFYDFVPLADGRWGVLVADVSGKGVPAALLTGLSRALVRAQAAATGSPAEILKAVNDFMAADNPTSMYVTGFLAILDPAKGELVYGNAGHNPPLFLKAGQRLPAPLPATGTPLGLLPAMHYSERAVQWSSGDLLVLYTDGVTEAFGPGRELFGQERLEDLVSKCGVSSADEVLETVEREVAAFSAGEPPSDDLTVVVLRWT